MGDIFNWSYNRLYIFLERAGFNPIYEDDTNTIRCVRNGSEVLLNLNTDIASYSGFGEFDRVDLDYKKMLKYLRRIEERKEIV